MHFPSELYQIINKKIDWSLTLYSIYLQSLYIYIMQINQAAPSDETLNKFQELLQKLLTFSKALPDLKQSTSTILERVITEGSALNFQECTQLRELITTWTDQAQANSLDELSQASLSKLEYIKRQESELQSRIEISQANCVKAQSAVIMAEEVQSLNKIEYEANARIQEEMNKSIIEREIKITDLQESLAQSQVQLTQANENLAKIQVIASIKAQEIRQIRAQLRQIEAEKQTTELDLMDAEEPDQVQIQQLKGKLEELAHQMGDLQMKHTGAVKEEEDSHFEASNCEKKIAELTIQQKSIGDDIKRLEGEIKTIEQVDNQNNNNYRIISSEAELQQTKQHLITLESEHQKLQDSLFELRMDEILRQASILEKTSKISAFIKALKGAQDNLKRMCDNPDKWATYSKIYKTSKLTEVLINKLDELLLDLKV